MKQIVTFSFLLLLCNNLSSQIEWEPLTPANLEDVQIIHVSEERILGVLTIPPKLIMSEDLGKTWDEIIEIPQLGRAPLVDVDRDGNYLVLFDNSVFKFEPENKYWYSLFLLPEAPVVWNGIAAFSNGNILIRERNGLRLYDSDGNFKKEERFGNVVTKNFIKGSDDEHYFFLSPGNVFGYIVKVNSDLEILETSHNDYFYIHRQFEFDGSRFYSTTGYSDDGRNWINYSSGLTGNITILNNGNIHLLEGCDGGTTTQDADCSKIYISSDRGETFEFVNEIDLGLRMPSAGGADLRYNSLMESVPIGEDGFLIFYDKKNFYTEDGNELWEPIGVDIGLSSTRKVAASTKENVFAAFSYRYSEYMVSDNEGWLNLPEFPCQGSDDLVSLPNLTLIGNNGCASANEGESWNSLNKTIWNTFVKDGVFYGNNRDFLFDSEDGGLTWSDVPAPSGMPFLEYAVLDFSSERYAYIYSYINNNITRYSLDDLSFFDIKIDNESIYDLATVYSGASVYVLTDKSFYLSEDNAETYVDVGLPSFSSTGRKAIFVDHENTIYLYDESEIWISFDEATSWQNITPTFQELERINMVDVSWDNFIFVATDGTPILRGEKSKIVMLTDNDNDGYFSDVDCDDNNERVNPGQLEIPYNGLDDDCDELTFDDDLDNDGFLLVDDCDDDNENINPNAIEIPNNQIDEDCDGFDLLSSVFELDNSVVKIFPNPAVEFININVSSHLDYVASLYDLKGQLLFRKSNSTKIATDSFSPGIYVIEIKAMSTGQKVIQRLIIAD